MTTERNSRKERQGVVVSASADKTCVVMIEDRKKHARYSKQIITSKKLHAHDEENLAGEGDTVRIMETRPMSRLKRWRLVEVVEKAK
ncbi:MAG: 30S ribosomal protein S17 [Coriobacteriia bacterium]|nr:30S ribosomal protein S17 [Coriobacteriia bacterium]MCL2870403.1 30S ribosomal protein S17 [Coriobacteriia bacterium]